MFSPLTGFLQFIGCLGALRLSERLLNAYWLILLGLLLGDAILGIFWMFKFDKIMQELQPMLRLVTESIINMQKTLSFCKYDAKLTHNKIRHDIKREYFHLFALTRTAPSVFSIKMMYSDGDDVFLCQVRKF